MRIYKFYFLISLIMFCGIWCRAEVIDCNIQTVKDIDSTTGEAFGWSLRSYIDQANNERPLSGCDGYYIHEYLDNDYARDFWDKNREISLDTVLTIKPNYKTTVDGWNNYNKTKLIIKNQNIVILDNAPVILENLVFDSCRLINFSNNLTIINCDFINCSSNENGGAINNTGWMCIENSLIDGCSSARSGGGIYSTGILEVSNSMIRNCSAVYMGGGVFASNYLRLFQSNINDNTAGKFTATDLTDPPENSLFGNGGGVYCGATELNLYDTVIEGNKASGSGGGLYIANELSAFSLAKDSRVCFNQITGDKGNGIYSNHTNCNLIDETISVHDNSGNGNQVDYF